ncbi:MAG: 4-hydroxybenzoate 3-monooxygenase [Pseudomonadota bacterium]
MRTQVGIVGAGPAGLMLAQMLHNEGIDSVIFEAKDKIYAIERVRAGVLEQGAVDTLREIGVGKRLDAERMEHDGITFAFNGEHRYIDVKALTGGRTVSVYGQRDVVKDLIDARERYSEVKWECPVSAISDVNTASPKIHFTEDGEDKILECDYIAGTDGFWGPCRKSLPTEKLVTHEFVYPYSWLGLLADAPPASHVVIYANHANGFALQSMRSPSVSRLYIQCDNDDDVDNWPDEKLWDELDLRMDQGTGYKNNRGPITAKGITPMRSFVCETMRHGRMFLAGDAAHIVPPTGAKGLNLAVADVRVLALALTEAINNGSQSLMDDYESICLERIWKVERFSWWVTTSFHTDKNKSEFERKLQLATLDTLTSSEASATSFAEVYAGLPYTH